MKGTAWRLYLGTGALATGAYFLLSPGAGAVLNVVVGASAAAAILAGARWHRPARRLAWWLIAAAQGLAVLSYDLERAKQRMLGNPAAVARVEHAQAALSTEVQGLRELMASLRPPTLDEVGLEAALRDHVGAFARRSGVDCSVRGGPGRPARRGAGDRRLPGRPGGAAERGPPRRGPPDLAGAGRRRDRVDLEIGDDGVGFEPVAGATLVRQGHFGLVAMQERVEMAGGQFQVPPAA